MKSKPVAAALAFFLGGIGAHKFYLGKFGMGILYLLLSWTLIPTIIGVIEAIVIFGTPQGTWEAQYGSPSGKIGGQGAHAKEPPQWAKNTAAIIVISLIAFLTLKIFW